MDFRILLKGEKGSNACNITGDVVTLQHQTVHPKLAPRATGQRISLTWLFDFADVTRLELLELAARSLVITFRAPFKTLDNPTPADWDNKMFNVREWIDNEKRRPQDKVATARKAFEGLTKDQIKALLTEYNLDADDQE